MSTSGPRPLTVGFVPLLDCAPFAVAESEGLFKKHGLDLQEMYPAHSAKNALQDNWTWETFLKYAELAQKDGMTFACGMGGGGNTDATDTHGALHLGASA